VEKLLELGVDVNAPWAAYGGLTALQAACEGGNLDTIKILLERGAEVNALACRYGGAAALQAAAFRGLLRTVEELVQRGADVNARPSYRFGRTALYAAVEGGHREVVEKLVSEGADIRDMRTDWRRMSLQKAEIMGERGIKEVLGGTDGFRCGSWSEGDLGKRGKKETKVSRKYAVVMSGMADGG